MGRLGELSIPPSSGTTVTVADEGVDLATAASKLDFVGAGVAATGAAGTKTITIPGAAAAQKLALRSGVRFWGIPGVRSISSNAGAAMAGGTDAYAPWFPEENITITELGLYVNTAAAGGVTARLGIYAADDNWQPTGAPILDAGTVAVDTTGKKTITGLSAALTGRTRYLAVINAGGAGVPNVQTWGGDIGLMGGFPDIVAGGPALELTVARAYAAFPNPGSAWTAAPGGSAFRNWFLARWT